MFSDIFHRGGSTPRADAIRRQYSPGTYLNFLDLTSDLIRDLVEPLCLGGYMTIVVDCAWGNQLTDLRILPVL